MLESVEDDTMTHAPVRYRYDHAPASRPASERTGLTGARIRRCRAAALFVQSPGVYTKIQGVDAWPEGRDARKYRGYLPVVAHPPCASWGRYARKPGINSALGPVFGDDSGCFLSALGAVRRCGGVLEHPRGSGAWKVHGLPNPGEPMDDFGGWTLEVSQAWWGHVAMKPTWLYIVGTDTVELPPQVMPQELRSVEALGKVARAATPPLFAEWLVALAEGCQTERSSRVLRIIQRTRHRTRNRAEPYTDC